MARRLYHFQPTGEQIAEHNMPDIRCQPMQFGRVVLAKLFGGALMRGTSDRIAEKTWSDFFAIPVNRHHLSKYFGAVGDSAHVLALMNSM
jgi:hypothetical protein